MSHAKCVIYVKNVKNATFDAYAIRHVSNIYIAIWVSKDASGSQKCRPISLSNSCTDIQGVSKKMVQCLFSKYLANQVPDFQIVFFS